MEEMALQGWVESHVSLAGGTGCSWGLPVGSPTWQTVVPVLAKSCWVRLAQASGWSWAKRHGYGQGGDGSVQSWVMVWGVGKAAVVSQHLSGRCWASHESVVMGGGGGGRGAVQSRFPINAQSTPALSQGCRALSELPLSLEEDVRDPGLHPPPFFLHMWETCSWV